MKIILNQDVKGLGEEGDVVEVRNGYARNFLLPKVYAVQFNRTNEALFSSRSAAIEKRKVEKRKNAESLREKLNNLTITIVVSAGDSGKLFGSVTNSMVQEALAKEGLEIDRKRIEVASNSIKMIGTYSVKIRLYENETAQIKVIVLNENDVKKSEAVKIAADKAAAKAAAAVAKDHHTPAAPVEEEIRYGEEGEDDEEDDL